MADIEVERRPRGMGWLWALLALIVLGLLIWWFFRAPANDGAAPVEVNTNTSFIVPVATARAA